MKLVLVALLLTSVLPSAKAQENAECKNQYVEVLNGAKESELNQAKADYLNSAIVRSFKEARRSRMAARHIEKAEIIRTRAGIGAHVRLCDQGDPGQANCISVYFKDKLSSTETPAILVIFEDWHTGGSETIFVCEKN